MLVLRRVAPLTVSAALSFVALAACSSRSEDADLASRGSDHTAGAVARGSSPFHFAPSTYEELNLVRPGLSMRGIPLSDSHPLAQRLQAWTDALDEIVRSSAAAKGTLHAPKPVIKVMQARNTFNAWVTGAPACFSMPLAGGKAGKKEARPVLMLTGDGMSAEPDHCLHPPSWEDRDAFIAAWNASPSKCKVTIEGGAANVPCSDDNGRDFGSYGASPFIHYSTDLIAKLDEKAAALVLAHELAHYYYGHQSPLVGQRYGFWYDQDPSAPRTPVPAENQKELESIYRAIAHAPKAVGAFKSKYNARTRRFLVKGAIDLVKSANASAAPECADALDLAARTEIATKLLSGGAIDRAAKADFERFEAKLSACGARIALVAAEEDVAKRAPAVLLDDATNAADDDLWELAIPENASTLADLFDKVSRAADDVDVIAAKFTARLRENKIGLYTTEQEADEAALEWMTKLGLSPDEILDAWIGFIRAVDTLRDTHDADACKTMLADGFLRKNANGRTEPMLVELGDLEDPHHGVCYRLYNLWRETRAHRYETSGAFPSAKSPSWDELRKDAAKLSTAPIKDGK